MLCTIYSVFFLGPKIWEILPDWFKNMESVEAFKRGIKTWKSEACPFRLCRYLFKVLVFYE